ncbi:MAG: DNA-directed RNA polymerase subunit alpha [Nitrospirae bacterium]|nr:DNA-directed RNA polymerase subunit alpha [Nitrospirota bacterium]
MLLDISSFQLPENVYVEDETFSSTYCKLIAEPLERGYGVTLGNALRRVLLSSIEGASITSIKIDGVFHEFSTVKGVKEDVVEIILNLKKVRLSYDGDQQITAYIDVKDKNDVTAGDIGGSHLISVLNPDAHIATLDNGAEFKAELNVSKGRGYVPAEELKNTGMPLGTIAIDAIFTPIRKVIFNVEKTRVGKSTDYDKLILEVWTDGSINPKEAVAKATQLLMKHLKFFLLVDTEEKIEEREIVETPALIVVQEPEPAVLVESQVTIPAVGSKEFNRSLIKTIDELELSVRSQNCLKSADIRYIYELVQKNEDEMLKMKNFGRKSFDEIREVLQTMGLDFDFKVDMEAVKRELATKTEGNNAPSNRNTKV